MIELAIVSGKGGTGKTSVVASFAALCDNKVMADCDVDASDLHLVLDPERVRSEAFSGGKLARIHQERCTSCGRCADVCRFGAVLVEDADVLGPESTRFRIDSSACEGCGACRLVCPSDAIALDEATTGDWFVSETRLGPLVHAQLGIGQEASGKLVTVVRSQAAALAKERGLALSLIDGSPGIGCPVIASVTGATLALVVTEPTMSGLHDLKRVAAVCQRLNVPLAVAVNRYDINRDVAREIEQWSDHVGVRVAGLVPYDDSVTAAQINGLSVVEHSEGPASTAIRALWEEVSEILGL